MKKKHVCKRRSRCDTREIKARRIKINQRKLAVLPSCDDCKQTVIVYQSELDYISRHILDRRNIETGGQLFGFYTGKGTPVVCYAIGPGARANHQVAFFNQDIDYLNAVGNFLVQVLGLQHIGEWHSHHQLGLAHPSGHDYNTMHTAVDNLHLGQFLLCIGTCTETAATINAFNIREGDGSCAECKWTVKASESPYRRVVDEMLKDLLRHPVTQEPALQNMKIDRITTNPNADNQKLLRAYIKKNILL